MTARRIDVHHHYVTPELVEELERVGVHAVAGAPLPRWKLDDSLAMMDRHEIDAALLSVPVPLLFGDAAVSRRVARSLNQFGAQCVAAAPDRLGLLATLPLPDVDAALEELAFALDELEADGIALLSNYDGAYLGDARFTPLFEELDRRGAVVHVHPAAPQGGSPVPALEPSLLEFPFDTTRALAELLVSGTLARFPSVRLIASHAGGTIPFLHARILDRRPIVKRVRSAAFGRTKPPSPLEIRELMETGLAESRRRLRTLFYDVALSTDTTILDALTALVPPSQILLGTDFPFAQDLGASLGIEGLRRYGGFDADARAAVEGGNARVLFPRFDSSIGKAA